MECEWVTLGCDGPSYCIGDHIIEKNPKIFDWLTLVSWMGHLHNEPNENVIQSL